MIDLGESASAVSLHGKGKSSLHAFWCSLQREASAKRKTGKRDEIGGSTD
jgi:hypothetical protein